MTNDNPTIKFDTSFGLDANSGESTSKITLRSSFDSLTEIFSGKDFDIDYSMNASINNLISDGNGTLSGHYETTVDGQSGFVSFGWQNSDEFNAGQGSNEFKIGSDANGLNLEFRTNLQGVYSETPYIVGRISCDAWNIEQGIRVNQNDLGIAIGSQNLVHLGNEKYTAVPFDIISSIKNINNIDPQMSPALVDIRPFAYYFMPGADTYSDPLITPLINTVEFKYADYYNTKTLGDHYGVINVRDFKLCNPVILDMNGDGANVTSISDSHAFFDMNGDGFRENVAWMTPGDAILAIDLNGNGIIDQAGEINFTLDSPGSETDLDGIKALFDSNNDGILSANDTYFNSFYVWNDRNGDGVSAGAELRTLKEANITSIGLTGDRIDASVNGNKIARYTNYTRTDGTIGSVADAGLQVSEGLGQFRRQIAATAF